jgi:hypothetical protein
LNNQSINQSNESNESNESMKLILAYLTAAVVFGFTLFGLSKACCLAFPAACYDTPLSFEFIGLPSLALGLFVV